MGNNDIFMTSLFFFSYCLVPVISLAMSRYFLYPGSISLVHSDYPTPKTLSNM